MDKTLIKWKFLIEWFMQWFVLTTTGILIICAINFSLFSDAETIPKATLWRILLAALLASAITAAFCLIETAKKVAMAITHILHFLCLEVAMAGCGVCFGWIDFDLFGMAEMGLSVIGVYVFVLAVYYILNKHQANQINQKLKERYQDEEGHA